MAMKRSTLINLIGTAFLLAGLLLLPVAWYVRNSNASLQAAPAVTSENSSPLVVEEPYVTQGKPISLSIPDLGISNQVIDGVFESSTQRWTLTTDKVQYALSTFQPNDTTGMTFMYGHNRRQVFSRLPEIREGMAAYVNTDNGLVFRYRFASSVTTKPEDVSIFEYSGPPILVLQTCTGLFYQNRQLFTFEYVGVNNV